MKVAYLGPADSRLLDRFLPDDEVVVTREPLTPEWLDEHEPDFLVSYGYPHIVPASVLERFPRRAINLHISLLPWNRGQDPNLWSFLEDTPKGVTIHFMDPGVDTGDLIAQRTLELGPDETLRTSHAKCQQAIEELFSEVWPAVRAGEVEGRPQVPGGTVHRLAERERYVHLLTEGWDTPVASLIGAAKREPDAA